MAPSIAAITAQAALLSVVSSVLAQALAAYQNGTPLFPFDWNPILAFSVYALVITPPNVVWQLWLESKLPGAVETPPQKKPSGKTPPGKTARPPAAAPVRNALVKTAIDQTVGSAVNQLLFCAFLGAWKVLTVAAASSSSSFTSVDVVAVLGSLPAGAVAVVKADFWRMLTASWRFWPWVSLGNFALIADVGTRNLVGGLAGVAWGVYVSLFAATA